MYKEKFVNLVNGITVTKAYEGKTDAALSYLERSMTAFPSYVSSVTNMETALQTLRFRLEPEDYRDKVVELDRNRKHSHDCAIDAINGINRMCKMCGVELLFTGDTSDRYAVADFCGEIVMELFEKRLTNQAIKETLQNLKKSAN